MQAFKMADERDTNTSNGPHDRPDPFAVCGFNQVVFTLSAIVEDNLLLCVMCIVYFAILATFEVFRVFFTLRFFKQKCCSQMLKSIASQNAACMRKAPFRSRFWPPPGYHEKGILTDTAVEPQETIGQTGYFGLRLLQFHERIHFMYRSRPQICAWHVQVRETHRVQLPYCSLSLRFRGIPFFIVYRGQRPKKSDVNGA